jgi:hypothetical protein
LASAALATRGVAGAGFDDDVDDDEDALACDGEEAGAEFPAGGVDEPAGAELVAAGAAADDRGPLSPHPAAAVAVRAARMRAGTRDIAGRFADPLRRGSGTTDRTDPGRRGAPPPVDGVTMIT